MKLVWEQELYLNFEYKTLRPHFHCFEADYYAVGLQFASVTEAELFAAAIHRQVKVSGCS